MRVASLLPLLALFLGTAVRACDECVDNCSIMSCAEDVGETVEYMYYCCANGELTDAGGGDCPCDDGTKKRDIAGRISLPLETVFERNARKARQA